MSTETDQPKRITCSAPQCIKRTYARASNFDAVLERKGWLTLTISVPNAEKQHRALCPEHATALERLTSAAFRPPQWRGNRMIAPNSPEAKFFTFVQEWTPSTVPPHRFAPAASGPYLAPAESR